MNKSIVVAGVVLALCQVSACERAATPSSSAAASAASAVEGVWRLAEVAVTGASPSTTTDPPSVFIFTKTHYSMMRVTSTPSRALFKAIDPVNEEKIAAYDTFIANSGTYELTGTMLTVRPIVAKHPNFMGGGFDTYEVRSSADTLWLAGKSTNIKYRVGDGLASNTGATDETTLKLIRVE